MDWSYRNKGELKMQTHNTQDAWMPPSDIRLRFFSDSAALVRCAASTLVSRCAEAIQLRGVFKVALSGGQTPLELFEALASEEWRDCFDWSRMHFFWIDERCVPPDHPASNFGMAHRALLAHVPAGRVFRMRGELEPVLAAEEYASILQTELGEGDNFPYSPTFDCVLLGMGTDGHTASLFPGAPQLEEEHHSVVPALRHEGDVVLPEHHRVTLTLPVLNAARCCLVVVAGAKKRKALRRALTFFSPPELPIQRIRPPKGEVIWMVDRAACFP